MYVRWPNVDPGPLKQGDGDRHINILNRAQLALFDYLSFFVIISSIVWQIPGHNTETRGTARAVSRHVCLVRNPESFQAKVVYMTYCILRNRPHFAYVQLINRDAIPLA